MYNVKYVIRVQTYERRFDCTMSSNAKFREIGPFSLKIDIKTSGTTFDLIKNASESFWKFGLLTSRPFGLWPLRPRWKFASANGCLIGGRTQNFIKIGQQMTDLHQFLCFSLGLLLSNFKGHLQENREWTQIQNFTKCLEYHPLPPHISSMSPSGPHLFRKNMI